MKDIVFVGHGDIMLDKIYDHKLNLIKQDGGGCNWNTLYNIAASGETCYAIGTCGKDEEGRLALKSLQKVNINTNFVEFENKKTNVMNIIIPDEKLEDNSIVHTWTCPITNVRTVNFSDNLPTTIPDELKDKDLYIVLDRFRQVNLDFIKNIPEKKVCLDIGHINYFKEFSKEHIDNYLKHINFVLLNNDCAPYIFEKLGVSNIEEFYNKYNFDLLTLTAGKHSAKFLFKENNSTVLIEKKPEIIDDVTDNTGAGDAFFAELIKNYAHKKVINTEFVDYAFKAANEATKKIVQCLGSRK